MRVSVCVCVSVCACVCVRVRLSHSVSASLLHGAAELLSVTQKLIPWFMHAGEAYNLQTERTGTAQWWDV